MKNRAFTPPEGTATERLWALAGNDERALKELRYAVGSLMASRHADGQARKELLKEAREKVRELWKVLGRRNLN